MENNNSQQALALHSTPTLMQISQNKFHFDFENKEITISDGEVLTRKDVKVMSDYLRLAFPQISDGWIAVFHDKIREKKLSPYQLKKIVNKVIETCKYPVPTIAEVLIDSEEKIKIYTGYDIDSIVHKQIDTMNNYKLIKIENGLAYFAHSADMRRFNIPEISPNQPSGGVRIKSEGMKTTETVRYNIRECINAIAEGREANPI
jgi:hypothetical protein